MAVESIVTDETLHAVLRTSAETLAQFQSVLSLLNPRSASSSSSPSEISPDAEARLKLATIERKKAYAKLAPLRGLYRTAVINVRDTKHLTSDARQEIDRLHLHLQNLYYEQKHLKGEIHACEAYDHQYLSLPLIPVEEFLSLHPENRNLDEHSLMIARINHEHSEREALESQRQELLKRKQELIAENKRRKDDLASLDQDLERFIDAAKPIQKIFEKEY